MDDNNISEKLQTLARGKNRSATARIREIFDQIETALHAGVLRKDVHQALSESGISLSFASFELAVYRIRKERGKGVMASSTRKTTSVLPEGVSKKLERPPGITNAAWSEMQVKDAAEKRRKT